MIQLPEDRRPPLTPQIALRVAVVGSIALAMFAIIFFRLWFLQVLSGDQYLAQASTNQVRTLRIAAPRGEIVDSTGNNILVDSKPSIAVELSPPDLPKNRAARGRLYRRLATVLGLSTQRRRCPVAGQGVLRLAEIPCDVRQQVALLPYADVQVATDVPWQVQAYLAERQDQFPGVNVQQVWLRRYPRNDLAAQLFGTVGRITPQEIHDPRYRGVSQNSVVGQSGLEWYYDRYLRGVDGSERVQVDALGHFTRYLSSTKPVSGNTLKLSLNLQLQQAGQQALAEAIANSPPAPAGAFVAMNPTNGEIYAMGSLPTFNPNVFNGAHPISYAQYNKLFGQAAGYPLLNRAIQSSYPTGSTFKGITATAALQSGAWNLTDTYDDSGQFQDAPGVFRHNAGHAVYGVLNITQAIMVSSDDFFYNLGARLNVDVPKGGALQQWARAFGIGRATGVDLGGENAGLLPSPEWRTKRDAEEVAYERKHHVPCCTLSDKRPWSVGDNENLAVGQGDLEATPLQLAVAYSALENGGNIVRPHVGQEVDDPYGNVLTRINPAPLRRLAIAPQNLDAIRTGLHDAASVPGGTSADVFAGWPQSQFPVYGKTGTAQHDNQADQSWYVCYVPDSVKPILVAVTVEQGGFGAQAAAPAAREILSQWFFGKRGQFVAGTSKTL